MYHTSNQFQLNQNYSWQRIRKGRPKVEQSTKNHGQVEDHCWLER